MNTKLDLNTLTEAKLSHKSLSIAVRNALLIICGSLLIRLFFLGSHDLLVEEAYYWNYAKHLDFGYLDHPPMVALLIKTTTLIFGTNEFAVRISGLVCWLLTAYFSFKLTSLINRSAGIYAVMLLSMLPFFFLQSMVITPDVPLILCWSATLYCLYQALVLDNSKFWYAAGTWVGLGLLSKYSIVLLAPATLIYMVLVPEARFWFKRKEPYICGLIAALLFLPVIYWNAIHEWASFYFQSTRRFNDTYSFHLHHFIILLIAFLLPLGVLDLLNLFNRKKIDSAKLDKRTIRFLQIFTVFPLAFFGFFSIMHPIKLDWIGPVILAVIPWIALTMSQSITTFNVWFKTSIALLVGYSCLLFCLSFGIPGAFSSLAFKNLAGWGNLALQFHDIARDIEKTTNTEVVFLPLDVYNIASELAFYQEKYRIQGVIKDTYPVQGAHMFGIPSLMYRYWDHGENRKGKTWILIAANPRNFNLRKVKKIMPENTRIHQTWSHYDGQETPVKQYFYTVVNSY